MPGLGQNLLHHAGDESHDLAQCTLDWRVPQTVIKQWPWICDDIPVTVHFVCVQSCTFPPSSCFGECLGMGIFGKPKGERGQVEVTTSTTTTTVTARNFGFDGGQEELMAEADSGALPKMKQMSESIKAALDAGDLNEFLELAQSVAFAARSSETPLSPSIHNPTWHDERGGLPAALTM